MPLVTCPDCQKEISDAAENCPGCGRPMNTAIKCPNCKSTNVQKISSASKIGSALIWGVFSKKMAKSYQCNSCKYFW